MTVPTCGRLAVMMLRLGADVNHVDSRGESPLSEAAMAGDVEMCRLLLDHGANVSTLRTSEVWKGWKKRWKKGKSGKLQSFLLDGLLYRFFFFEGRVRWCFQIYVWFFDFGALIGIGKMLATSRLQGFVACMGDETWFASHAFSSRLETQDGRTLPTYPWIARPTVRGLWEVYRWTCCQNKGFMVQR